MFPSCCHSRPATSFRWFTSPLKTLRYIIWRNYKWIIIGVLITLLIVAAIVIFLYSMPVSMMFVNSWALWTPGLVNPFLLLPHKMWRWKWRENAQYVWFLCTSDWLISKPMMKGRKRNSVRGLVNQSVLTNFAVYSGTMVYRIKWNEMKWKLLIGSQLTPGKKKKHWWPYGTRSVPNTLVYYGILN